MGELSRREEYIGLRPKTAANAWLRYSILKAEVLMSWEVRARLSHFFPDYLRFAWSIAGIGAKTILGISQLTQAVAGNDQKDVGHVAGPADFPMGSRVRTAARILVSEGTCPSRQTN